MFLALSACVVTLRGVHEVAVTDHAIERYRERVRPGFGFVEAEADLLRVLGLGVWSEEPPGWAFYVPEHADNAGFVLLGDDVVFPVSRQDSGGLAVTTCLVRGDMAEQNRRERRAAKKAAQAEQRRRAEERRALSGKKFGHPVRGRGLAA
jgi:hypothetical protein